MRALDEIHRRFALFTLQHEDAAGYTSIPDSFIENYMPKAAGEFVKIYIYLLKCISRNEQELSVARIADVFENTEKDVVRALKYWARKGLFKLTFNDENQLTSLMLTHVPEEAAEDSLEDSDNIILDISAIRPERAAALKETAVQSPATAEPAASDTPALPEKKTYSKNEIDSFSVKEDIPMLILCIQKYLGKPLSASELNSIMFMHEELGFSPELIDYLFDYCVSKGHKSIHYIEKTAIAWAEQGIGSVDGAKKVSKVFSKECYAVLKAFGLTDRNPVKSETDYVNKWVLSYGFSQDLIVEACDRTMQTIHKPNFAYADRILEGWYKQGINSLEQARAAKEAFIEAKTKSDKASAPKAAGKFNQFQSSDTDYSELEDKLFG